MLLPSAFSKRSSCDSMFQALTPTRQPCGSSPWRVAAQPDEEETPLAFSSSVWLRPGCKGASSSLLPPCRFLRSHTAAPFLVSRYLMWERRPRRALPAGLRNASPAPRQSRSGRACGSCSRVDSGPGAPCAAPPARAGSLWLS